MSASMNSRRLYTPITRKYTGSDTLYNGYALCYDTAQSAANDREANVVKPAWANLVTVDGFAGVVVNAPSSGIVGNGTGVQVDILPWNEMRYQNVNVFTDENVAAGDLLSPLPGFYQFGRAVIGRARFQANAASDRSTTSGFANGTYGPIDASTDANYIGRYFNHFRDANVDKVVANIATGPAGHFLLNGTTAVAFQNTNGSTPAGTGLGELSVVGTTTTIGQIQQAGAQWLLTAGRSLFCRQRVKIDEISDEDWFFGLGTPPTVSAGVLTAVAQVTSAGTTPNGTDYMGFFFDATGGNNGFINFNTRKASGTQQYQSLAAAFVNDTYIDLAFLVRNRLAGAAAGAKTIYVWMNGVLTVSFTTATYAAATPDTVPLSWAMSGITGGCIGTIDRLEINQSLN